jgi:Ca2+/Na+ antiporter
MSPGVALGYLFWTRHRRGLTILAGYLLLVVFFCRFVWGRPIAATLEEGPWTGVVFLVFWMVFLCLLVGLAVALGYLLCIFVFSREVRRFEACESGFPRRLRHLPLPTLALAGWPMLWGSVTVMLVWLVLAWGALRPCGFNVPLGWPALLLAVVLAWVQAIIWTPFPLPLVRAVLFFPVASVLVFVPMSLLAFDVTEILGYVLLAVLLPAAYWTAIHGVSRARRGANEHWSKPVWLRWPWAATRPRPPFVSAARAQLWFEWRRGRIAFPLGIALSGLTILPFVIPLREDEERLLCLLAPLITSFCLASMCGAELGRLPGQGWFSSFIATRPLATAMLARVKFEAALLSAMAGWAGMIVGLMLWLALSGHVREIVAEQIGVLRQRYPADQFSISLALLTCGPVVLIWMQMAGTLWVTSRYRGGGDPLRRTHFLQMAEKLWVGFMRQVWSIGSVLSLLAVSILLLFSGQASTLSEHWRTCLDLLPWLAGCALVLKSLAAAWSLSRLKRNALVPSHVLIGALAAWSALAISLLIVLRWLIPRAVVPTSGLVLGIVLFLPLTRLALAPLALAWNRHQ